MQGGKNASGGSNGGARNNGANTNDTTNGGSSNSGLGKSVKAVCQPSALSIAESSSSSAMAATDPATQFRSTLALGQLITAKTPSAGSRIIAGELRQLSIALKHETAALRKEISSLPASLAESLKTVLEEDREQRNSPGLAGRRPVHFGNFPYRRFPVYRIPRRVSLAFARKSVPGAGPTSSPPRGGSGTGSGASALPPNPTAAAAAVAAAMKSAAAALEASSLSRTPSPDIPLPRDLRALDVNATKSLERNGSTQQTAAKTTTPVVTSSRPNQQNDASRLQTASKSTVQTAIKTTTNPRNLSDQAQRAVKSPNNGSIFKNPWFSRDRSSSSYDGEADTDSESE